MHSTETIWERVGDDLLLLDTDRQLLLQFSGESARIAERLLAGGPRSDTDPGTLVQVVQEALVGAGALNAPSDEVEPSLLLSRRSALAAGAALGITVLALPVAAAASSSTASTNEGGGGGGSPSDPDAPAEGFVAQTTTQSGDGQVEVIGTDV